MSFYIIYTLIPIKPVRHNYNSNKLPEVKQFTVTILVFFTLPLLPVKIIIFPNKANQCARKAVRESGLRNGIPGKCQIHSLKYSTGNTVYCSFYYTHARARTHTHTHTHTVMTWMTTTTMMDDDDDDDDNNNNNNYYYYYYSIPTY
jgi:hypothetical protein